MGGDSVSRRRLCSAVPLAAVLLAAGRRDKRSPEECPFLPATWGSLVTLSRAVSLECWGHRMSGDESRQAAGSRTDRTGRTPPPFF